jgi:hypothetical protein
VEYFGLPDILITLSLLTHKHMQNIKLNFYILTLYLLINI